MANPHDATGHLARLTSRLQVTAYVSGGLVVFSFMSLFTPGAPDAVYFFLVLLYPALFVLCLSALGAVGGRLMLAAQRDDEEQDRRLRASESGQD